LPFGANGEVPAGAHSEIDTALAGRAECGIERREPRRAAFRGAEPGVGSDRLKHLPLARGVTRQSDIFSFAALGSTLTKSGRAKCGKLTTACPAAKFGTRSHKPSSTSPTMRFSIVTTCGSLSL